MTDFSEFVSRCKMRYDFSDQIQVRYQHANGDEYDTWVSGNEAIRRLGSEAAEKQIRGLGRLSWGELKDLAGGLPSQAKNQAREEGLDWLAGNVEEFLGSNVIGDTMADRIRGRKAAEDPDQIESQHWTTLLQDRAFRAKVLDLAWIQLEGSFPIDQSPEEPNDWI